MHGRTDERRSGARRCTSPQRLDLMSVVTGHPPTSRPPGPPSLLLYDRYGPPSGSPPPLFPLVITPKVHRPPRHTRAPHAAPLAYDQPPTPTPHNRPTYTVHAPPPCLGRKRKCERPHAHGGGDGLDGVERRVAAREVSTPSPVQGRYDCPRTLVVRVPQPARLLGPRPPSSLTADAGHRQ
jgi:hypothetical protein